MLRHDIFPVLNTSDDVCAGAGSSVFVQKLCEPLRNVSRVELCSLVLPPESGLCYVLVSIDELGMRDMPVMFRGLHHHQAGTTFTLDCNPDWHMTEMPSRTEPVTRLSVSITRPDRTKFDGPVIVAMMLRITHAPLLEVVRAITWAPDAAVERLTRSLMVLDTDFAEVVEGHDVYHFVSPCETPLYDVCEVRLLGMRMPPLFWARDRWEPYCTLVIPELNVTWPIQHSWFLTDKDIVDWSALPEYHVHIQSPVSTAQRLTVRLLATPPSGGQQQVLTAAQTSNRFKCCLLLQLIHRRLPYS